jgi:hypothetical protein
MSLEDIDVYDQELLPVEAQALVRMLEKREQYVNQGRAREAHGAGTMIWIMWTTLKNGVPPEDETSYGSLL